MKKSEIPIALLASVLITIVGISLFIGLAAKGYDTKKAYCSSLYQFRQMVDGTTDPTCESYKLKSSELISAREVQSAFAEGDSLRAAVFNSSSNFAFFDVVLPSDARIWNASLLLSLPRQTVRSFSDGLAQKSFIFPLARTSYSSPVKLPANAKLSGLSFEVSGARYPSKADIAFVIDTSKSMANEWSGLCTVLDDIKRSLASTGVNATINISGLGHGATFANCKNGNIEIAGMASLGIAMTPMSISNPSGPDTYTGAPWDEYTEAWALGTAWVAKHNNFRMTPDVKRIIVPIGDSDPTGGGQNTCTMQGGSCVLTGDSSLSGNEDAAVDLAISAATMPTSEWVYVVPVYGNEDTDPPVEGYHIGVPLSDCQTYTSTCWPVVTMMMRLAASTGGELVGYSSPDDLKKAIMGIIISNYPKDVTIKVNGQEVLTFAGRLDNLSSPLYVNITDQQILDSCSSDCTIEAEAEDGTLIIGRIKAEYTQDLNDVQVRVGDATSAPVEQLINLTDSVPELTVNLSRVPWALGRCTSLECPIIIRLETDSPGAIQARPSIEYSSFQLPDKIVAAVLDCWRRADYGRGNIDITCEALPLPEPLREPLTEQLVTDILMQRGLCSVLPNKDYGCGSQDRLSVHTLQGITNVLVSYKNNKVIVE